jgi:hypothetical protein
VRRVFGNIPYCDEPEVEAEYVSFIDGLNCS